MCEVPRPRVGKVRIAVKAHENVALGEPSHARHADRDGGAIIDFRIKGSLRHDRSGTGPLKDQGRSIGLMSDELDRSTFHDVQAGDRIPLMKQTLSLLKEQHLKSEVMQVVEQ